MLGGSRSGGVSGAGGGSLMVAMRNPAAAKASAMACNGRCQKVRTALYPSKVYSSEYLVSAKYSASGYTIA